MRTDCLSFPPLPNPICSNKRLKGRESWDPAGQEGRDNNTYPWATFQHMQPFHAVLKLLFRQEKGLLIQSKLCFCFVLLCFFVKDASGLEDATFLSIHITFIKLEYQARSLKHHCYRKSHWGRMCRRDRDGLESQFSLCLHMVTVPEPCN